jgi:hypothetical protein
MIENDNLFYNWSDEDFSWKRDGQEYTFKAGSVTPMTKSEFDHFAKHLVDRELPKAKYKTNDELHRKEYTDKCRAGGSVASNPGPQIPSVQIVPQEDLTPEQRANLTSTAPFTEKLKFCEYCDSKGVRHMKNCTRSQEKIDEKPFADAVA